MKSGREDDQRCQRCEELYEDERCTHCPLYIKVVMNDLMRATKAEKQGVKVRVDIMSGLTFAGDMVGISETQEGLQKQIEEAIGNGE